jgi:methylthioribose-1-phosphate isomerase
MPATINPIRWVKNRIVILDQTLLPHQEKYLGLQTLQECYDAIKSMKIRGAPLIGIMAGYSIALYSKGAKSLRDLLLACEKIRSARPTAVNLFWAVERMKAIIKKYKDMDKLPEKLLKEAKKIHEEDRMMCERIGKSGSRLIKRRANILTICNTGALATGGTGTALSVIIYSRHKGIKVYVCETRPFLQGARLTMWELKKYGIESYLICDSVSASLMQSKKIDCVITGADRIAKNGDVANKIGTYMLAVLAKVHNIPFYIAAPFSTFDPKTKTGADIVIEQRPPEEVTTIYGRRVAPQNTKVINPAFDVTPAKFISAFITDKGVIFPPFENLDEIR